MSTLSHDEARKRVWRVCRLLGYVTIFEVGAALLFFYQLQDTGVPKLLLSSVFIILSAAKAYYIMSEFMHLKYELKAMTLTIVTPFLFLVWGIIAFLWEGAYWLSLKELWR
ncbi:MAG: cytochrome C oxidase subunit IV family protein [Chitinophagales bacterium]|nr:cytochrome C oxidase subunit IV family protein [Chitinophagales bacterium]